MDTGLVQRGDDGIKVVDANLLLDAWREDYRFDRHTVITGHVAARSGDALTRSLAATLSELEVPHAATGLSAAWLWTRYAGFRLATVYLADIPSEELMAGLGFREVPRGANTWLVVPNDAGVFHGAGEVDDICCVHPVQAYLDLQGHPERAQEAAEELRSWFLSGVPDDAKPTHSGRIFRRPVGHRCPHLSLRFHPSWTTCATRLWWSAAWCLTFWWTRMIHRHCWGCTPAQWISISGWHSPSWMNSGIRNLSARLRSAGFAPDVNSAGNATLQRWVANSAPHITVDFLIPPQDENSQAGRLFHIKGDFAAIITEGLDLAFRDRRFVTRQGCTPSGEQATRDIPVCGPGAFTVLKALAFRNRGENKDAYDLHYVLSGLGYDAVARSLASMLPDGRIERALDIIREDFTDPNLLGPRRVAQFLPDGPNEDIQQDVVGQTLALLREMEKLRR